MTYLKQEFIEIIDKRPMDTFKRLNSKVNDSNEHFKHKIRIPLNESAFYNASYNIK